MMILFFPLSCSTAFIQFPSNIPLSKFIGETLGQVIRELNIDSRSYDFGGGLDDNILEYLYFEDRNSNTYIIWIETPPIILPNFLISKNYAKISLDLFYASLNKKVTHISLSCTKNENAKYSGRGFKSLHSFKGKKLSAIMDKNFGLDFKITFDDWNQVFVLRVRHSNLNISEIHIDPSDKRLKKQLLTKKNLSYCDIKDSYIKNIRIYSGSKKTDLSEGLLSLDGRSDK